MVTRCGRVETRALDARRDARAFARGDDISPVIPKVTSGTSGTSGETREGSGAMASIRSALRGLGLGASAASARGDAAVDAPRYSREQREREANSGVETRGRSARDRAFVNERGEGSLGVSRGTWFAGAAESLARVGAAATETPTTARETREDDGAVEDEPSSSTRDALSGARTTVATTTATTRRHARCRSSRRLLGRPRAVRRRSRSHAGRRCVRSGDARRAARIADEERRRRARGVEKNGSKSQGGQGHEQLDSTRMLIARCPVASTRVIASEHS